MSKDTLPIAILIILTIVVGFVILWDINRGGKIEPVNRELPMISENTLIGIVPPVFIRPIVYATLIDCLIQKESGGNPEAVGDKGLAFGILQYHRATFDHFCGKYNLTLDYKNPDHQIRLCDLMLEDDFNNIKHWSVYKYCYDL